MSIKKFTTLMWVMLFCSSLCSQKEVFKFCGLTEDGYFVASERALEFNARYRACSIIFDDLRDHAISISNTKRLRTYLLRVPVMHEDLEDCLKILYACYDCGDDFTISLPTRSYLEKALLYDHIMTRLFRDISVERIISLYNLAEYFLIHDIMNVCALYLALHVSELIKNIEEIGLSNLSHQCKMKIAWYILQQNPVIYPHSSPELFIHCGYTTNGIQFSPDGTHVLVILGSYNHKEIEVYSLKTREKICEIPETYLVNARFSADGLQIIGSLQTREIATWKVATGRYQHGEPTVICWIDLKYISIDNSKTLSFYHTSNSPLQGTIIDARNKQKLAALEMPKRDMIGCNDGGFTTNGERAFGMFPDRVLIWHAADGILLHTLLRVVEGINDHPKAANFSTDGRRIVVGYLSGVIKIFDVMSGKLVCSFEHECFKNITAINFSPDDTQIFFATLEVLDERLRNQLLMLKIAPKNWQELAAQDMSLEAVISLYKERVHR